MRDIVVCMRALSVKQAIELSEVWKSLEKSTVFVAHNGREFLVEGPEDRQDRWPETEDDQGVLRIWVDSEDAWMYAEEQEENYEQRIRVMQVDVERLFKLKHLVINNGFADFGVHVRADVCVLRNGEPIVVDTLWSANILPC